MSPQWVDEVVRQNARLNADRVPRILSAVLALTLAGFFIDPVGALLCLAFYLLSEVLEPVLMRNFAAHPSRLRSNLYLGISFMGTTAYAAVVALMWMSPSISVNVAAIVYLCGGLVTTVGANTVFMPMAISKVVPLTVTLIYMPLSLCIRQDWQPDSLLALSAALLLTGYLVRVVLDMHRTERQLAQSRQTAEAASQAKSRFLAAMGHDILTPMNAIMGVTRMLAPYGQTDNPPLGVQPLAQSVGMLEDAALTLQAIIDDAMAVAEQTGAVPHAHPVASHLRKGLAVSLARLQPEIEAGGLRMDFSVAPDLPDLALFDPVLLRRCLGHLIRHALTATLHDGSVMRIRADRQAAAGGRFVLEVSVLVATDLALPAPGEDLAGAIAAAELMGGRVEVPGTTDHPARFRATLPMGNVEQPVPPNEAATRPEMKVLVVDDISTNRFILVHLLQAEGVRVTEADSGKAALQALAGGSFDLVLLDMNMPDMSGADTFRAIRASAAPWATMPVVALTTDTMKEQRKVSQALGMSGFVAKPVDRSLMMAEIEAVLAKA